MPSRGLPRRLRPPGVAFSAEEPGLARHRAGRHLQVVGGAGSGKSTLLRSLPASFALTHAPDDVQFYGVDLGGGGLSAMNRLPLPHVGGVATHLDPERVRRTTATVHGARRADPPRSAVPRVRRLLPGVGAARSGQRGTRPRLRSPRRRAGPRRRVRARSRPPRRPMELLDARR
ncbi:FtsK/SpoIIIE domain-containing protein [Streptomyces sp. NPDC018026]|uniref:FtsK/SpoIIIE domain-containing protein n=1 Tax=Streptomyces sp. NPDC018026 TaxID=3365031 RepID=UPI0037B0BAB7